MISDKISDNIRMSNAKCKICRRAGVKLFLRGEKCLSPKCPMVRKAYAPGQRRKRPTRGFSEYAKELKEKQKLKNWYNLREEQLRRYITQALRARGKVEDTASFLIQILEKRLDNVIFRLGFAPSRDAARQMVSHGHFLVNGRTIDVPSYSVKKEDKITVKPSSAKKNLFKNIAQILKKQKAPSWLELDAKNLEAKVVGEPKFEEAAPPAEISAIFEFYSR
jgi:small subunit ribosomal protein S4